MTVMPTAARHGTPALPRGRALTRADFDTIRDAADDGHRYELIDGVLVVTPGPRFSHQRALGNLHLLLREQVLDELEVLLAPFDVALAGDTVMQPDLIVARTVDFSERDLPGAPVLAVEVLSPSTRSFDLHTKKDRLRRAGCAHYWVVDPDTERPSITAWRLHGTGDEATYDVVGTAVGDDELVLTEPFPVTVVPQRLVER